MKIRFCKTKYDQGLSFDDLRSAKSEALPGPWQARDYPNAEGGFWIDCRALRGPKSQHYHAGTFTTIGPNGLGGFSAEKTAIIVSAAPELLDLLIETVDEVKNLIDNLNGIWADYAVEVEDIENGIGDGDEEELELKKAKRDASKECFELVRRAVGKLVE